jgi:hypothetical protein
MYVQKTMMVHPLRFMAGISVAIGFFLWANTVKLDHRLQIWVSTDIDRPA